MLGKKRVLAIAGVACILVASLSVVYVAASPAWTIDDMVKYMEKTGQAKIWKTCYLVTNDLKPKVADIQNKMGQGLVGEVKEGYVTTSLITSVILFDYKPPNPKKVSLYIETTEMKAGDKIEIRIYYWINGRGWVTLEDLASRDGSITKTFIYQFEGNPTFDGRLILDQLPVYTNVRVWVLQSRGLPRTIYYQAIIEEV